MRLKTYVLIASLVAGSCRLASAASFSQIVAFGDSLTDAGNVSIATAGGVPSPGYATRNVPLVPFPVGYYTNPQFSSGPAGLWIDQFAAKSGVTDPMPFLAPLGGTNYAIGGAFTAGFNGIIPGMDSQIGFYLSSVGGQASSSNLYSFWGGSDDILNGMSPVAAADNVANEIKAVAASGGKNFLWFNLPPLGDTPELNTNPLASSLANAAASQFDAEWATDLIALDGLGINVTGVDVNSLFNSVIASPGSYGFTNVSSACMTTTGCNPNTYLYWDQLHPTTTADSLVANLAYADLNPVPEPPSVVLLGLGTLVLAAVGCRRNFLSAVSS